MSFQYEQLNNEYEFEEFLKDLFNLQSQTESFELYKSKGQKQFGLDVYSPELAIAIQAKKKDLKRNTKELQKELLNDLEESLNKLQNFSLPVTKFILASNTPKYGDVQEKALQLSSSDSQKNIQFMSWSDMEKEIHKFPLLRTKYYPHLTAHSFPKELTVVVHPDHTKILGRSGDIKKVSRLLHKHEVVAVQSVGGVGKTTFLRSLYQSMEPAFDHLIWLEYSSDYKRDFFINESLQSNLGLQFDEQSTSGKNYGQVLAKINLMQGKKMVFIDNLQHETPLNLEEELTRLLRSPEDRIVFTSREHWKEFKQYQLPDLNSSIARKIFHQNCTKETSEEDLDLLIKLSNNNTLLVSLIAKVIQNSINLSVSEMNSLLEEGNFSLGKLDVPIELTSGGSVYLEKLYNQISRVFDFSKLNNWGRILFYILSICPSGPLPIQEILDFFNIESYEHNAFVASINELNTLGLVERSGDYVSMHPLIQDVFRIQVDQYTAYAFFILRFTYQMDQENYTISYKGYRMQQYAESILIKLVGDKAAGIQQPLTILMNNLLIMYLNLGQLDKWRDMGRKLLAGQNAIENFSIKDPILLSTIYHNIATVYYENGDNIEAEQYFLKAITTSGDQPNIKIVQAYNGLYNLFFEQSKIGEAFECCEKAEAMVNKCGLPENDYVMAMVHNQYAMLFLHLGKLDLAAKYIHQSLILHINSNNHQKSVSLLAVYRMNAAAIYSQAALPENVTTFEAEERHKTAILFIENAIRDRLSLQISNDGELKKIYRVASVVYNNSGHKSDEYEALSKQ